MNASHEVVEATKLLARAGTYHRQARQSLTELQAMLAASNDWEGYSNAQHDLRQQIRAAIFTQSVEVDDRLGEWNTAKQSLVTAEFLGHTVLAGFEARRVNLFSLVNVWEVTIGRFTHIVDAGLEAGDLYDEVEVALAEAALPQFADAEDPDEFYAAVEALVAALLARSVPVRHV
jgi:hypothetical protein